MNSSLHNDDQGVGNIDASILLIDAFITIHDFDVSDAFIINLIDASIHQS